MKRQSIKLKALIAAAITTLGMFTQNMIPAHADPYHEMVPFNELRADESTYNSQAVDSEGNTWVYYKYEDGTICLDGIKEPKEHINIPSTLNNTKVTGIKSLTVAERQIKDHPEIKSVKIPGSVRRIEANAFIRCINLEKIDMTESTTRISKYSFSGTKWLDNAEYKDGFLIVNKILLDIKDKSGEITIPSGVLAVGEGAGSSNNEITKVTIPKSMIEVRKSAFSYCQNLKEAVFENNLTFVEPQAFSYCENLTEGKFPVRNKIATYAFSDSPIFDEVVWNQPMLDNVSRKPETSILSLNEIVDKVESTNNGQVNIAEDSTQRKEGWNQIGNDRYYVGIHNEFVTGWKDIDSKRYYFYSNGQMAVNFVDLGGNAVYYFDPAQNNMGALVTGWKYIDGKWYYFNPSPSAPKEKGYMQTAWFYDNGNWYYFYGNGQMATGFINLNGAYYYLDESSSSSIGIMKSGWQKINGYWYYFNKSSDDGVYGMMKKGWQYIDGNWYYFYYGDGKMAANTWIDGYYVNSSGAWVK